MSEVPLRRGGRAVKPLPRDGSGEPPASPSVLAALLSCPFHPDLIPMCRDLRRKLATRSLKAENISLAWFLNKAWDTVRAMDLQGQIDEIYALGKMKIVEDSE